MSVDISAWISSANRAIDDVKELIPPSVVSALETAHSSLSARDETFAKSIALIYTKFQGGKEPLVRSLWASTFPQANEALESLSQKAAMAFIIAAGLAVDAPQRPLFLSTLQTAAVSSPPPTGPTLTPPTLTPPPAFSGPSLLIPSLLNSAPTASPSATPSGSPTTDPMMAQALISIQQAMVTLSQQVAQLSTGTAPGLASSLLPSSRHESWRKVETPTIMWTQASSRQQVFSDISSHIDHSIDSESIKLLFDVILDSLSLTLQLSPANAHAGATPESTFTKQFGLMARALEAISFYITRNHQVASEARYAKSFPRAYYDGLSGHQDDLTVGSLLKIRAQAARVAGKIPSVKPKNRSRSFRSQDRGPSRTQDRPSKSPTPPPRTSPSRSKSTSGSRSHSSERET